MPAWSQYVYNPAIGQVKNKSINWEVIDLSEQLFITHPVLHW